MTLQNKTIAAASIQQLPPQLMTTPPLLTMSGVSRRYGDVVALQDVSATVYPGEVLGIVGESGSGKSTLLRMMNLEDTPDSGDYRLNLPDLHGNLFHLDRFERRMLLCAPDRYRVSKSASRPADEPHQFRQCRRALADRGRAQFAALRGRAREALDASEFPLARMDARPMELSGGMQQRVQLAKAIALEPALLLLDEPTTGLDVSVQALVLDTLKRLQRDRAITMVIVSHDLGVIRTMADRVMVMRGGAWWRKAWWIRSSRTRSMNTPATRPCETVR